MIPRHTRPIDLILRREILGKIESRVRYLDLPVQKREPDRKPFTFRALVSAWLWLAAVGAAGICVWIVAKGLGL